MLQRPRVLLVQLPIPPAGAEPVRGNVPLAAGYLKLFARRQGLEDRYEIEILPSELTGTLGDRGLVEAILAYQPSLVGFTCYLWNVDRSLWLAEQLKARQADLTVLVGGPEVTADNRRLLAHEAVDLAAIGEGEATFAELLGLWSPGRRLERAVDGLWQRGQSLPSPRRSMESLDAAASPYLEGILDVAEEKTVYLETVRGCTFKCKFCYYPKSYTSLCYLSPDRLLGLLRHAENQGAEEVVLLDPTFNQRKDFGELLELLAQGNPNRRMRYFGELRAEGITPATAGLLAKAHFTEVEVGLQAIDPKVQELMHRRNNLTAFERGVRAMLDAGIQVKVDLIIGLPGDSADSIRRSVHYLADTHLYSTVQVFNLSILPGTTFRQEAEQLGLVYQQSPPYYVLRTPTLALPTMVDLMEEAQEVLGFEWDLPPELAAEGHWQSGK